MGGSIGQTVSLNWFKIKTSEGKGLLESKDKTEPLHMDFFLLSEGFVKKIPRPIFFCDSDQYFFSLYAIYSFLVPT